MTFNRNQKIATIGYCICLVVILLVLTPNYYYGDYYFKGTLFGNFFLMQSDSVAYKKLFFELGLLSVIYFFGLIMLKENHNKRI
jgi:hypothetical protein